MSWDKVISQQLTTAELYRRPSFPPGNKWTAGEISRLTLHDRTSVLARIIHSRQRGQTFGAIAAELNQQGVRGRNGARWYSASVRAFLMRHQ
jgi:hypothetical protein